MTTPMREADRRRLFGTKWCFRCRKHQQHDEVEMVPVDPLVWYGTHWRYECSQCKGDFTRFPT